MSNRNTYYQLVLTILFLVQLGACKNASAQFYSGCSLGLVRNEITDSHTAYQYNAYQKSAGISTSLKFGYALKNKLYIETGLAFLTKSYGISRDDFFQGTSFHFVNSYIQLPLIFGIEVLHYNKIKLMARAGGYSAYWIYSKTRSTVPNILVPKDISDDESYNNIFQIVGKQEINESRPFQRIDRRIQLGIILGAEICYRLSKKNTIFFEPEFQRSLTGIEKRYQESQSIKKNQAVIFSIGLNHSL